MFYGLIIGDELYRRIDYLIEFNFPVMGIPGTIDNDIFGTSHTLLDTILL
jgi:6-phosphofructokinase